MIKGLKLINCVVPYSKYFGPDREALNALPKEKRDAILEEHVKPRGFSFPDSEAVTFAVLFSNVIYSLPSRTLPFKHLLSGAYSRPPELYPDEEYLKSVLEGHNQCESVHRRFLAPVNDLVKLIYDLENSFGFKVKSLMSLVSRNFSAHNCFETTNYPEGKLTEGDETRLKAIHGKAPQAPGPASGVSSRDQSNRRMYLLVNHYASLICYTARYVKYSADNGMVLPSLDPTACEFLPISVLNKIIDGVNHDKKQGQDASSIGGLEIDWGAALEEERVPRIGADLLKSKAETGLTTNPADNNNLHTRQGQENIPAEEHISKRKITLQGAGAVLALVLSVACGVLYSMKQTLSLLLGCICCGALSLLLSLGAGVSYRRTYLKDSRIEEAAGNKQPSNAPPQ